MIFLNYIYLTSNLKQSDLLMELPSPVAIYTSMSRESSLDKYCRLIAKTEKCVSEFKSWKASKQDSEIKKWLRSINRPHVLAQRRHNSNIVYRRGIMFTELEYQLDITKLDVLRLARNEKTVFHTRHWLNLIYNSTETGTFSPNPVLRNPPILFQAKTGPRYEPPCTSFETFYTVESKRMFAYYIGSGRRPLSEMSGERMVHKIAQVVYNDID